MTTPAGTSANTAADDFTYQGVPTVTAISPIAGPAAGGTTVVITGTNFIGATAVRFGTVNATSFTVNSATQITAVSPAGTVGSTVQVSVTTPAGTSANTAADDFTYQGVPTVTAISPIAGPAAGGTTVVITGTNFIGATAVRFGTVNATSFTVNSATQITAVSPAGTVGSTVQVSVTTPAGTSANTAADDFTYGLGVTINQAATQLDPATTSPINFTVQFTQAVSDFATGDVTLAGTAGATTATVTGSGTTYNVAVTGMTATGTVIATIAAGVAHDAAAFANTASTSTDNTVTYQPGLQVTINQAVGQGDPTNEAAIDFTVVFTLAVTDFATGDVTLAGTAGATTATVTGSGTTYNVAVTGMTTSGTVIATIAAGVAHDAATNPNPASTSTDNTVTYDNVAPTVTIDQAATQSDPTSASPISFTVVFSEPVVGFINTDVTLAGAGAVGATAQVSGSGATYTVNVAGMTAAGPVTATIPAGGVTDAAGNMNVASTSADNTVTYNLVPASVIAYYDDGSGWLAFSQYSGTLTVPTDLRLLVRDQNGNPMANFDLTSYNPMYYWEDSTNPALNGGAAPDLGNTTDASGYLFWNGEGSVGSWWIRLGLDVDLATTPGFGAGDIYQQQLITWAS